MDAGQRELIFFKGGTLFDIFCLCASGAVCDYLEKNGYLQWGGFEMAIAIGHT